MLEVFLIFLAVCVIGLVVYKSFTPAETIVFPNPEPMWHISETTVDEIEVIVPAEVDTVASAEIEPVEEIKPKRKRRTTKKTTE